MLYKSNSPNSSVDNHLLDQGIDDCVVHKGQKVTIVLDTLLSGIDEGLASVVEMVNPRDSFRWVCKEVHFS